MAEIAAAYHIVETARDHLVQELAALTVGSYGLPPDVEADLRRTVVDRADLLLELADSAVAARVELEAVNDRLDRHVRTHLPCVRGLRFGCTGWKALVTSRNKLERRCAHAYRALLEGRR